MAKWTPAAETIQSQALMPPMSSADVGSCIGQIKGRFVLLDPVQRRLLGRNIGATYGVHALLLPVPWGNYFQRSAPTSYP